MKNVFYNIAKSVKTMAQKLAEGIDNVHQFDSDNIHIYLRNNRLMFVALLTMVFASTFTAQAQMIDQVNLESYAKSQYGSKFDRVAGTDLADMHLDPMGNLTYTYDVYAPGMSQGELYVEMANWFICNYDNAIQFADRQQGILIARPYVENIARYTGGFDAYDISICPTLRAQVEDGCVHVTYTLHDYSVVVDKCGGKASKGLFIGAAAAVVASATAVAVHDAKHGPSHPAGPARMAPGRHPHPQPFHHAPIHRPYHPHHTLEDAVLLSCIANSAYQAPADNSQSWPLRSCYPFAAKDKHKKASNKAFIMAHTYSQVVIDNIQAAIQQCSLACN